MTACSLFGGSNLFRLFSIPTWVDSCNGKAEGKAGKGGGGGMGGGEENEQVYLLSNASREVFN